jgi:steroid delta-isomerase-like uncharacterized protein
MLVLAACSRQPAVQATAERNKALHQRYIDEMNRGNAAFVDEYLASTAIYHGPMGDLSKDQFIEFHNAMLTAFPDVQLTIEDQIAEGDKVVTRWTARGTHKGNFQGIAPTDREVVITGIIISRIEGGKEVESWEELNLLGLMQQLATLQSPGEN